MNWGIIAKEQTSCKFITKPVYVYTISEISLFVCSKFETELKAFGNYYKYLMCIAFSVIPLIHVQNHLCPSIFTRRQAYICFILYISFLIET